MASNSEALLEQYFKLHPVERRSYQSTGVLARDPRIMSAAAWRARQFYIDEIPQLVNILIGEMSLVGPRPLENWLASRLMSPKENSVRHSVLPGLTGLGQTRRRSKGDIGRRMVHFDLIYVKTRSAKMDFRILVATIFTVLSGQGVET